MDNDQIHSEVFENASEAFYVFEATKDGRFRIEAINRAAEKLGKRSRADLVGKYLEETATSEELQILMLAKYNECIATGMPVHWDGYFNMLAGRLYIESTLIPIRNDEGRIGRILGVCRDGTEQKHMQDALRQSEQRNREVFENSSDSIYLFSVTPAGRFIIEAINPAMQRATGISSAELCGKDIEEVSTEFMLKQIMPMYRRCVATRSMVTFDVETDYPVHRWLDLSIIPLPDSGGNVSRLMVVARDVTARKQAEQALQRAHEELEQRVAERTLELQQNNARLQQEMREREATQAILAQRSEELARINAELEAFSYSLSHDLRAPLRAIDGFARLLAESCTDKLDSAGRDYLRRVTINTQRMNQLINGMLKLFRMSQHEMQLASVDLSELARHILAELERAHSTRRVTANIEPHLSVYADTSLIQIAMENLLSNAWKFTGITPEARIEVGHTQRDGKPCYFVRDNGAGFDMSQANRVFTPFQRLHSEGEFEGTGIGLAIVQRVIGRHGGRIWLESQVNRGTTVYFALASIGTSALKSSSCA